MAINIKNIMKLEVTQSQCKDAGMAFVLVILVLNFFCAGQNLLYMAVGFLVVTMSAPGVLKPLAKVWFGIAQLIGTCVSKLILFTIFYTVVTPVGLIRRLIGKDNLKLTKFKKDRRSVMDERNMIYKIEDIIKPF